jgi:protein ImuB
MRSNPPPPSPLALIAKRDNTLRLAALDEAAEALGLEVGLPLAAARARVPDLTVREADPAADAALLTAIGEVCRRYTPAFALDPPDGVHLDISGTEALFGGEAALIEDLSGRLRRQGIAVRIGAGETPGLAWALARHGDSHGDPGARARVCDLPVVALRLDAESLGVLHRLGLRRVGQILDLPRPTLARRLGEPLLLRLDEILGRRAAAFDLSPEPVVFFVQHRLAEPIALEHQVLGLCRWLCGRLAERMAQRGVGGRAFRLDLFRVDGVCKRLVVQSSRPIGDPARISALFSERLASLNDGLEADFGFDLLRLTAQDVQRARGETTDFMGGADDGDLTALIDRFAVRLGPAAIRRLAPAPESRIPEQAVKPAPFASKVAWESEAAALYDDVPLRPLTLFSPPQSITVIAGVPEDPPQQFTWRRATHRVSRAEGPERIAWEWWRAPEPKTEVERRAEAEKEASENAGLLGAADPTPDRHIRDYYRVEDEQGRRFWVFREGLYAPGARPRWFLHGLFP